MKRKVIQLAHKTLVVSLPSKWVKKFGVKKGNEVDIEEKDNEIIIRTKKELIEESITINVKDLNKRVLRWTLSALHKTGYDKIELIYEDPKTIEIVQKELKDLFIGFIITEQTSKRCVLKSISKDLESEFDTTLRRAFLVTLSIGKSSLDMIKKGECSSLRNLTSLERTNNQLTNFCERILNKKGYTDYRKTCFMYIMAWNLEKVCDNYKYICEFLSKPENSKIKLSKIIIKTYEKANNLLEHYYEVFYKFDIKELNKLVDDRKEMVKEAYDYFNKASSKEMIILNHLLNLITKTSDFSASMIASNLKSGSEHF